MAGYFTAIVRAPITGIILIFEMTGSFSQIAVVIFGFNCRLSGGYGI